MKFLHALLSTIVVCVSYQTVAGSPQASVVHETDSSPNPNPYSVQAFDGATLRRAGNLTDSCRAAASALLTSDFGKCADLNGLISIMQAKESIVPPFSKWVSNVCSLELCTRDVIAAASQEIKGACRSDLENQSIAALTLVSITAHYRGNRAMVCLQQKKDSSFCLPLMLSRIEAHIGMKITAPLVFAYMIGKLSPSGRDQPVAKLTHCHDCSRAFVSRAAALLEDVRNDPPGRKFNFSMEPTIKEMSETCGPGLKIGEIPDTIITSTPKPQE